MKSLIDLRNPATYYFTGSFRFRHISQVFVCLLCLVCALQILRAQGNNIKFTALTTRDGLSGNTVNEILKDKLGLLWMVTPEGLDRYDGKNFKVYTLENPAAQYSSKAVNVVYEDKAGNLWAGAIGGGLFIYDRQKDVFKPFFAAEGTKNLSALNVNTLCSDGDGKLWLGLLGGIDLVDPKTRSVEHLHVQNVAPGKIPGVTTQIFRDSRNRMWVCTYKGVYLFDEKHNGFQLFTHQAGNKKSIASDSIVTISQDKSGQVWIGTLNGLSRFERDGKTFTTFRYDYKNEKSLCGDIVYSIAPDGQNTIWVGTEGGLNKMNTSSGEVTRYQHDPRDPFSINSKSIRCIYIDPNGIYWIGTYMGGLNKYDKNQTLFNVKHNSELDPYGLNAGFVSSFAERKDGDIYVGTDGGGLSLFHIHTNRFTPVNIKSKNKTNSAGLAILTMLMDRRQQLWIGTYEHGLFKFNTENNSYRQYTDGPGSSDISQNNIFCLKEDREGKIWIGTNGAGLNVFDPTTEKFLKFPPGYAPVPGQRLPSNGYIRAIEEDGKGNIWIGSNGSGISIYHPQTKTFDVLNAANTGLPINTTVALFKDRNGTMWIGTGGHGLFYFDTSRNKMFAFKQNYRLPTGVICKILQAENGDLWFSTDRNICRLNLQNQKLFLYSQDNGVQSDSFLTGSALKASNGAIFFGGANGFNYFRDFDIKLNRNIPPVIFTSLNVESKQTTTENTEPLSQNISQSTEVRIKYKQDFAINYIALNYTLPQQNHYAYMLQGFNKSWKYVGTSTTAYYTNIDPGEYIFKVKASNNDGVWNDTGASIRIIITPPFWMTTPAYMLYLALILAALWITRLVGIRKLKKEMHTEQLHKEAETRHELDNMKIKFLTNLSHEFRTPISLILAPADKLLMQYKDQQMASQINVIKRNARRLLNLVNQLLDFKKLEEHELKLNRTEGEFISFILDITDTFRDLADAKQIKIVVEHTGKKIFALFDHGKIERILFNLLSNALKFTHTGGIVTVEVAEISFNEPDQLYLVGVSVRDTGIGLSSEQAQHVFDRFYQVDAPASMLNQGSGIGLSITRELVEIHGGKIAVESEPGVGSTFKIELPLTAVGLQTASQRGLELGSISSDAHLQHQKTNGVNHENNLPHVLLIEDNDELRFYLEDNLKAFYKISVAVDGRDGWHKALSKHPDLIVSDIGMPYMDGITLSRKLKADKRTNHIPVILLTAQTGFEEQMAGLKSGAADYLTKPFNFDILNIKIRNLLAINQAFKETYQKQIRVMPDNREIESTDEKFLNRIVLYIEENFNSPRFSVEDLSHQFGMSRGSLYSKIMELTGQPPVDFIRTVKLSKAALLLEKSDLTISQIAFKSGFATPHYFTKSFKAKFNMLPSEYRHQKKHELHHDKIH